MKDYSKSYAAPTRRNRLAVAAFQRSGAGIHGDKRPDAGPEAGEWEELLREAAELDSAYAASADYDAARYAEWLKSLDGHCCECGDKAPEGEPHCVPCWDAIG